MRFPPEKMDIAGVHEGKAADHGWLVLDISKLDLDGVTKLHVNLDEVEALKQSKGKEASALSEAKKLLGG